MKYLLTILNAPRKIQQTVNNLKDSGELLGVGEFLKVVLFAKDNLLRGYGKLV